MNKMTIVLRIVTLLFLVLCSLLTYKLSNGLISNLQVYFRIRLIPFTLWMFIILIAINFLVADSGFIKVGAIILIFTGIFTIIHQMVNTTASYDIVTSEKHELLLETLEASSSETYNIYKKENAFYSRYVGSITVANYYDKSYEIVGDTFVVTKCTDISCITAEIDLE